MSDRINAVHVLRKLPVRYIQPLPPSDLLQLTQGLGGRVPFQIPFSIWPVSDLCDLKIERRLGDHEFRQHEQGI